MKANDKQTELSDLAIVGSAFGPYKRSFVLAAICACIEATMELVIPFTMAQMVDAAIPSGDAELIVQIGIRMLLLALVAGVSGMGYAHFAAEAAMGFGTNLRRSAYAHVQRLSFSNLDHFDSSSLVTRLTSDVTVIQDALVQGFRPLLRGPIMLVMGLILSFTMSPQLTLVFAVTLPCLALALFLIVHHVAPYFSVLQQAMDRLNAVLQENLVAIHAVKAYVREPWAAERFEGVNRKRADIATTTFSTSVLNMPIFQASMNVTSVCLLWFGGQMILNGTLGIGALTGFMSYVLLINNSLRMISNVFLLLVRSLTSIHRVGDVLCEEPELKEPSAKQAIKHVKTSSFSYDHVSFQYTKHAEKPVLSDITLSVPAGSTLGILGGTGSGKSSMVQLLARLYDVSKGSVVVSGHDVRDYDIESLREAVGIVLQKNVLFTGTVRQNLAWGNPHANNTKELTWACYVACVDEFLDCIGGLDADLGHGGANLSGGQRQRLCIARALLKHPKILIFDDATSACDMKTDALIRSRLSKLTDVTKVIVAQRVTSVQDADQIVILDDGKIEGIGTHQELLAHDPIYRELCVSQNVVDAKAVEDAR